MRTRFVCFGIFLTVLAVLCGNFSDRLYQREVVSRVSALRPGDDAFRSVLLSDRYLHALGILCEKSGSPPSEFLTSCMLFGQCRLPSGVLDYGIEDYLRLRQFFLRRGRQSYERFLAAYRAVWDDVACFPVAESGIVYENSWMFERTYGGKRGHEGTDLIPPQNLSGYYHVVSMTDGVVEKLGWLEKGGYRIGIRGPSGGYYYYAHLDSCPDGFSVGQTVKAGQFLGYMGDTGYGPEGTRGRFDVHLHVGIYIETEETAELSVNPYWVLRYAGTYAPALRRTA